MGFAIFEFGVSLRVMSASSQLPLVGGSLRASIEALLPRPLRKFRADGTPVYFADCLNEPAEAEAMDAAEERLGFPLAPALRQLFSYADGQQAGSPPLLVVPSNRHVTFLSLRQARDLALYWQEQARHPLQAKYWQGYNRLWVPIGWASKFHVSHPAVSRAAGASLLGD
ncbi:unnamed protein product [Prorocentrum cordatum]|uniref:Uncharacterized protein n=1 Tax=Prorocentrum cordatum TaxID=2364126 RepID=A0ABN9RX89_9DINO|nr:unnamed protein product [Polarella glacialis]